MLFLSVQCRLELSPLGCLVQSLTAGVVWVAVVSATSGFGLADAVGVDGSAGGVFVAPLGMSVSDAGFCGLVYARSWPSSVAAVCGADRVLGRVVGRGVDYWVDQLVRSPVRVVGVKDGRWGFALVTPEPDGLEFSYLFVEPEAFGSGLAAALYSSVMGAGRVRPDHAWVLECNVRSLRFFGSRGWVVDVGAVQPLWADGFRYVRLLAPPPVV